MGKFACRRSPNRAGDPDGAKPLDPKDLAELPTVVEFLTLDRFEDGAERVPGTILLFAEAGTFKACIVDKDAGLVAFTAFKTLRGVLAALERDLAGDGLDWRVQKDRGAARRR